MAEKKTVVTEEKFKNLCEEALPILNELAGMLREAGAKDSAHICIGAGGYLEMNLYGTGWSLHRYNYGEGAHMRHDYQEPVNVKGV